MSTKDDGGPVYPSAFATKEFQGITLRDYFAAHCPAEYLSGRGDSPVWDIAKAAYTYADAMLKAREEP